MTFIAVESSAQSGSPVEIYDFTLGLQTFRYTTSEEPMVVDAQTYTPLAVRRSSLVMSQEESQDAITVRMPASNTLVRRYINVPPGQQMWLTIRRLHRTDSDEQVVTIFKGLVRSVAFSMQGLEAEMVVQPLTSGLSRETPRYTFMSSCNHVLYDTQCKVNSTSFRHIGVLELVSGVTLSIRNLDTKPDGWATGGFIISPNGTDYRMVLNHTGDQVTLMLPFTADVGPGAEVQVFAGCDHSLETCVDKFNNGENFGGFAWVPRENVFVKGV